MDKYLKDHGFDSIAHLDIYIQAVLRGTELQKWQDLKVALVFPSSWWLSCSILLTRGAKA